MTEGIVEDESNEDKDIKEVYGVHGCLRIGKRTIEISVDRTTQDFLIYAYT